MSISVAIITHVTRMFKENIFNVSFDVSLTSYNERLPVLHHSADYIFISFGIIGPIMVALKMEFCSCIRQKA